MADYYGGSIKIGGELRESDLPAFIEVLAEAGFDDLELDKEIVDLKERVYKALTNILEAILENPQALDLSSSETKYGQFEDVESFCRMHGLVFKSHANAYCEYPAVVGYFDGTTYWDANVVEDEDSIFILRNSLFNYLEAIDKMVKEPCAPLYMNDKSDFYRNVSKIILASGSNDAIDILKRVMDEHYPDLALKKVPALTII